MRVLTGIQSSGTLHIGNYFGAIKQMMELQNSSDLYIFIANYHSLSSVKDADAVRKNTIDAAITYLSLGINPIRCKRSVRALLDTLSIYSNGAVRESS